MPRTECAVLSGDAVHGAVSLSGRSALERDGGGQKRNPVGWIRVAAIEKAALPHAEDRPSQRQMKVPRLE